MPARGKPFEQFGPYLLLKRLETSVLGDLWRAVPMENGRLGPLVALRRLTGGHRPSLIDAAEKAAPILPQLSGTTFVKAQRAEIIDGIPCLAFEYSGGRSLRHIVDRARGSTGIQPQPIPLDQAMMIAERIALSLATTAELKAGDARLPPGVPLPHLVWVSDDGEVRLAGQTFGSALMASLSDPNVYAEIGAYFAPERSASANAVYSLGAVLFLLVTGTEPPDPLSISSFTQRVRAAKTMTGDALPLDVRTLIDKSLTLDVAARYPSISAMKQALDAAAAKTSATTFNLAFYLNTLLKKELDGETIDREKESRVNLAAYTAAETAHAPSAPPPAPRRRLPLIAAAAAVALIAIGGAAVMLMTRTNPPPPAVTRIATSRVAATQPVAPPVIITPPQAAPTATADPEASRRAFEEAVNQKMQQEMLKLQSSFDRDVQRKQPQPSRIAEPAPVQAAAAQPARVVADDRELSAAALDQRRIVTQPQTATQAPLTAPAPVPQPATEMQPAPPPAQAAVSEGDLVDLAQLDTPPRVLNRPVVQYPPIALRRRAEGSVIVTALVSENGDVLDVRILRGDDRFGFNDAAVRAARGVRFAPALKDGKRVKTWYPQTIYFRL